jgi:hypothetical protein
MKAFRKWRAGRLHTKAQHLGDDQKAIKLYLKALELDQGRSTTLYNIGLIYKYQLKWKESLEFNARAYLMNPEDEATRWNYAIAATALRDWNTARRLWSENGIMLDGNQGPIEMDFGATPLRLNPDRDGEVVWGRRIDPARARIENVPLPDSGFRHGDVVLNDGAAVGYRILNGSSRPVFNVLQLFEASSYSTYVAVVEVPGNEQLQVAFKKADSLDIPVEDWTENIRMLCKQCSEGTPHKEHDSALKSEWNPKHRLGLAISHGKSLDKLIQDWAGIPGFTVLETELALKA